MADDKVIAGNATQFLTRVTLTGAEVPAFVEVINWLAAFAGSPPALEAPSDAS